MKIFKTQKSNFLTTYNLQLTAGLTLLEAVVYVAILAMLFVVVVHTTILAANAFGKSRIKRSLAAEGYTAMARMVREIRFANRIDEAESSFGVHPGSLALVAPAEGGSEIARAFALNGDILFLTEGAGEPSPLSRGMRVTNLVFYLSGEPPAPRAVRVEMTVESSYKSLSDTRKFYGTAVLRGGN